MRLGLVLDQIIFERDGQYSTDEAFIRFVDAINFIVNTVETIPQDEVLASLRLFAAEVMPRFRKRS